MYSVFLWAVGIFSWGIIGYFRNMDMKTTLATSFSFCVSGCLTFVLLSFPSLCPAFICKLLWFLSVDEDVFGVLVLGTWDSKTSFYFRLLPHCILVAVHRQITWFRATAMNWPKLDEAMNAQDCKEPVSMIWVIFSSSRFQFSKALY